MDQTTLTQTLRSLAADAPLHPSPSADARRRAARLRRRHRTVAAGLVAVAALGTFGTLGVVHLEAGHPAAESSGGAELQSLKQLADPSNPNHATTGSVAVPRISGGRYFVYWQGKHVCFLLHTVSECASVAPGAGVPLTLANVGQDATFASVAANVASVRVAHPDGTAVTTTPVAATGFPYRVVVAQGKVMSLRALDKAGKQIGDPVAGPDALKLQQVTAMAPCTQATFGTAVKDTAGTTCYQLAPVSMNIVPKSVDALDDATQGWLIQVALDDSDAAVFGRLTSRLATQGAPGNQLAIVLDGRVLSAPTIQEGINGGLFQITGGVDTAYTEQVADALAAQLRG